ncbi:MAG: glycosyltransferase family 2 protein [Solobacterium sp.]|nr:glycosyltransferase family 2 protein [Solobacterium sp.]
MKNETRLSVVVPCYNEQDTLPYLYEKLTDLLKDCAFELILVDDGSRDRTEAVIRDLAARDERVKYILFSRNFGKESAMYAGFCYASGSYVCTMDADLQDPPELLLQMMEILDQGEYDIVASRRMDRKGEPPVRSFFARRFYRLINRISDTEIPDGARDFRMLNRKACDALLSLKEVNRFSKGLFAWIGFKTYWLTYENVERSAGKSKWSFVKLTRYALDGIISFSEAPLSLASWFGLLMTVFAGVMLVFIVVRKLLFGDPVAGWASTICVIIFIGGLQLFCLGIIGQYIAKIYTETKGRPNYIVKETNLEDQ